MSEIQIQLPWERMTPLMRNHLICDLIGAEKLGQYHVFIAGRDFLPLPCGKGEGLKAQQMEDALRGPSWREFAAQHGLPNELRDKVEVRLVEWPLRYSDTPGGGWVVIEAICAKGFVIEVKSHAPGWSVLAYSGSNRHEIEAPTMAEAACLVARQCIMPSPLSPEQVAELAQHLTDQKPMYVIYDHPPDYPNYFVVRTWKSLKPTDEVSLYDSLDNARLGLPPGLNVVAGGELPDEEKVLEVWA